MSNRIIKDTIAITVITLVAGLALGVVQDITADPIAKQEAQAKQDAYKAVFADADSFETVDVDADAMQSYLAHQISHTNPGSGRYEKSL